jgi:competence protein ComEA
VFLSVLAGLTILGARVGPRTSAIAAPAPHPVASLEAPTVPVASLPDVATPVASASAAAAPPDAPTASPGTLPDGRVVLNLANEDDLTRLPHIGPARAKAILTLRQKLGKFHTVSELLRVKGLGRRTLAKLAPRLLVDPPPDASTKG